jgi:septum site-determining protein MinD
MESEVMWDYVQVIKGHCTTQEAILPCATIPNLYLLPTSQIHDKMAVVPDDMVWLVDQVLREQQFDFVLIDCPAGIERGFDNAVAAADSALVVVTPEVSSIRDADRVIDLLQKKRIMDIQLVINRYRPDLVEQGDMLDVQDIWQILAEDIAGVFLESEEVLRSSNCGVPVVMNDSTVLHSLYADAAHRVLGREVPLVDLQHQESNGVWSKFLQWARVQMGA